MELKVTTLEGKEAGSVQLSDEIFGLEPRKDIMQRCVQWQLNKRQAGTHKAKGRAEIWRTGKKMYKQKGTGGARHGSARGWEGGRSGSSDVATARRPAHARGRCPSSVSSASHLPRARSRSTVRASPAGARPPPPSPERHRP